MRHGKEVSNGTVQGAVAVRKSLLIARYSLYRIQFIVCRKFTPKHDPFVYFAHEVRVITFAGAIWRQALQCCLDKRSVRMVRAYFI